MILAKAERLLDVLSGLLLGVCLLAVTVQIVMRYVFNAATAWSDPVASDSLAWLTFLGASAAVRKDSNLYVRFTWNWLGPAGRKGVETFSHLVVLGASLALLYSAKTAIEVSRGTVVEGIPFHVSLADLYSVTAVSGLMMALFTIEHLVVLWLKPAR